jgi:16S rRNA (cytidine1402-2'-O)-methyltransferase
LYLVATPIGNLGDVSARALDVLRGVDWIAAEDTRHTRRLLTHFGISAPLFSAHAHNERARAEEIVTRLAAGTTGALVVDAGSPGVSDPGSRVVAAAIAAGRPVRVVPGPSAVIAALSVSGLDTSAFTFAGFLPARAGAREARLTGLLARTETLVLYEAPHRARATLESIAKLAPLRRVAACRELTKVHEEVRRGVASAILAQLDPDRERGEWALVIEGAPEGAPEAAAAPGEDEARRRFIAALVETGVAENEARERAEFVLGPARGGSKRATGRRSGGKPSGGRPSGRRRTT